MNVISKLVFPLYHDCVWASEIISNALSMIRRKQEIDLNHLYAMMKPCFFTIKKLGGQNNRLGFPTHRGAIFGLVRPRKNSGILTLSADSKKYPAIYDELFRIGNELGFIFNSIQVNRNCMCPPHKDKKNVGDSMLISFGEYTGGEIVVEGTPYNAFHHPLIFNGAELEHYNNEADGDKFSIIFFVMQ